VIHQALRKIEDGVRTIRLKENGMKKLVLPVVWLVLGFPVIVRSEAVQEIDYRDWVRPVPGLLSPYRPQPIPAPRLENSPRLKDLIIEGKLELSLSQALALALENNLDIEVQRYILPIAQTDVLRALSGQAARGFAGARVPGGLNSGVLGAGVASAGGGGGVGSAGGITGGGGAVRVGPTGTFDPSVSINYSWDETVAPLNTQVVAGVPSVTTQSTAVSETYAQLFPTGTSFFLSLTGIRQDSTQNFLRFNPAVISRFAFGINQPLLRGFGLLPNLRFLRVARNNEQVSEEVFRMQVIDIIVDVVTRYRDLSTSGKSLEVAEQSLEIANSLLEQNILKARVGTLSRIDVMAARSEVASRQRDVIVTTTNVRLQERLLPELIMRRMVPELEQAAIVLTDPMPEADGEIPDLQTALDTAYSKRPALKLSEVAEQNQAITARFTRNGLLPNLSVFGFYASSGLDGDTLTTSGGTRGSLEQVFNSEFPQQSVGLSFQVPIRNRAAQADDLRARLEYNQLRVSTQKKRNDIAVEVHRAMIGLTQGKAQVEAARQALVYARESHNRENISLGAGLSTPYVVTLRARDLTMAKEAEVIALASYAKALIEMQRATGTTLESYGIEFEDAVKGTTMNKFTESMAASYGMTAN
jgi:outer membrane protein TolC